MLAAAALMICHAHKTSNKLSIEFSPEVEDTNGKYRRTRGNGEKDTTKLTHSLIPKDIGQFVQQQEHECSILTCIRDGIEE